MRGLQVRGIVYYSDGTRASSAMGGGGKKRKRDTGDLVAAKIFSKS